MNIIKYRYIYFAISLLVIIPGLLGLIIWKFPLGIDFTGGSLLEIQFASGKVPAISDISQVYSEFSTPIMPLADPVVQPLGTDSLSIRSREMDDATKPRLSQP